LFFFAHNGFSFVVDSGNNSGLKPYSFIKFSSTVLKCYKYLLTKNGENYKLEALKSDTPFYQHIGILKHLRAVAQSGGIYTYHFNLLRNVLEKTATFHG
jgi:hypothetical protein